MSIEKAISNLSFDAKIRANSSIAALKYVDLMIEDFKVRQAINKADILLDVFGLLQGLFVAIDALYQLSFTATKYKYHVNINQNRNLKHLKYLRNDIVGHPTNRNYEDGSFGFSVIIEDEITKDQLSYMTYIIKGKKINRTKETVYFNDILNAYQKEKVNVLKDLESYLDNTPHDTETTGLLVTLFENTTQSIYRVEDLNLIEDKFLKENNLHVKSNHRFLYRLRLLKGLFIWQDETYQEIINYTRKHEILSIYRMNLDITGKKIRIPVIQLPETLNKLQQVCRRSKHARNLIVNLNDIDHPLFTSDLEQLIQFMKDPETKHFLKWFKQIKDRNHSFAIGKIIKDILR
ncbi:MAG: hypothetical protein WCZ19_01325 [Acholeplasma sp.]